MNCWEYISNDRADFVWLWSDCTVLIRKRPQVIPGGGAHPLHPPPRSAPGKGVGMWGQRQGDFSNLPAPGFGYSCELQLLWIPHLNSVSWDGIVLKLTKKVAQWQTMLQTMMQIRLWMKDRGWRLLWKVIICIFVGATNNLWFLIHTFPLFHCFPPSCTTLLGQLQWK